jgi:hypothetical protein
MKNTFNKFTDEKIEEIIEKLYKELDKDQSIRFLKRLVPVCFKRKYTYDDLYQLSKRNEKFGKVWSILKDELECRLAEQGLDRIGDSSITKFVLMRCHGWAEKTENTNIETINVMPDFGDE